MKPRFFTLCAGIALFLIGADSNRGPVPLRTRTPIQGTLMARPIDYWFDLESDRDFKLSIEKVSTGIAFSVLRPDGSVLRQAACSHDGLLEISEIAPVTGRYTARLESCLQSGEAVSYMLALSAPGIPTDEDRRRVQAERLAAEAEALITEYREGSLRMALARYQDALNEWKGLGNLYVVQQAKTLTQIARIQRGLGQSSLANESAKAAFDLAGDSGMAVEALLTQATILLYQGDESGAKAACMRARGIARFTDPRILAEEEYWTGRIHYDLGLYDEAARSLEEARRLSQKRKDSLGAARAEIYLGALDFDNMLYETARDRSVNALSVFTSFGALADQAMALTYIGHSLAGLGKKQDALNRYGDARLLVDLSADNELAAALLNGFANVHYDMGDTAAAMRFYKEALDKSTKLNDRQGMALALRAIGNCYFATGDYANALASYDDALKVFKDLDRKRLQAYVLEDIGVARYAAGMKAKGIEALNESLKISQGIPDRRQVAWTKTSLAHIQEESGDCPVAVKNYEEALGFYETANDGLGQMTALHGMAKCLIRSGRLEEASSKSKRAIELIEKLRTSVADLGLRRSYFATARQQYALYIDILMQLQREREAFGISELARARTLLDSIGEIGVSLSEGADPAQLERATSLRALLLRASERYSDLVGAGEAEAEEAAKLAEQIQRYITELDRIEGQMRAQNSRYAARGTLEPLELEDIQRDLLDDKSILLEYAIGDENIYLWVVTKTGFNPITLSTRRSEIEKKALRARELLASPTSDPSETAAVTADLSRILLPKEAADLLGERRMVIVDEGILQYLPFGALPSPQSATTASPVPLIRDHEIVNLPSASTLAAIRQAPLRRAPTKTVAVFANPVYGAASGLPALPGTRKEWEAISEVAPKNGQFGFLGDAATREAVMNQSLKDYKIIHFATHAILDEKQPDLSRLVLSLDKNRAQQDVLFLRDIYNLRLSAELVVLSACDTGVGKDIQGEGLISLVRGFMYSGTPRVVASLWKVDDKSTTALMREFYTHYLKNGKNGLKPSDALRQAQISLSQKENLTPYDWAAFQLYGDWN